jgi:hypothetical protein
MTTPIAERVAKPSHGRAFSGDLSYSDDRQLRSRDRARSGVVVSKDVAPQAHPGEVDLLVGEGNRDAGPVGRGREIEIAAELLGQVGEERLVGLLRLRRPDSGGSAASREQGGQGEHQSPEAHHDQEAKADHEQEDPCDLNQQVTPAPHLLHSMSLADRGATTELVQNSST